MNAILKLSLLSLITLGLGLSAVDAAPANNKTKVAQPKTVAKPKPTVKPGNIGPVGLPQQRCQIPNMNNNGNGNKNKNNNRNGNGNTNTNSNVNKNNINNDIKIKLNLGKNPGNYGGGYGDGGYGGGGYGGGGYGYGGNNGYGNGMSYSPTFQGGTYSPSASYNPSYNPSYVFDYSGSAYYSGYGVQGMQALEAAALPPMPALAVNEDDPDTAWLVLELPNEQAEVWLNNVKMPHKGPTRKYISPPLKPDLLYSYEIRVQWADAGTKINYATTVQFKAGDEIIHKVPAEGDGKAAAPMPKRENTDKNMEQKLGWVKDLIKEGKIDKAKGRLKEIIEKNPDSEHGQAAKQILDKLNN